MYGTEISDVLVKLIPLNARLYCFNNYLRHVIGGIYITRDKIRA